MPVEIRELIIRVNVNERNSQQRQSADTTTQNREQQTGEDAVVSECIEQVFKILNEKKER